VSINRLPEHFEYKFPLPGEFDYDSAMQYFRRRKTLRLLPWLLACALVLRSFIAPGYMLTASAEDGMGIIFCDGLVSLVSQSDHSGHHHHHGSDEVQAEVHISPICSKWSTSGLLVINTFYLPETSPSAVLPESNYQAPFIRQFTNVLRPNRGPPSFSQS